MLGRILVVTTLLCAACDEPAVPPDQQESPQSADELYGVERVWHIDLQLSGENLASLREFPRTYVEGDVRIGNKTIEHIGIRLKGAFSFQGLGGKASFKLKFNKYQEGQRFVGLEKLTLNNMRQDRSQVHEWLGYQVFRAGGVPAPRSGYAWVNDEIYGLYANVETVDDRFLSDRFEEGDGNLYEAPWGADLDIESMDLYQQDEGDDTSRTDLGLLVAQVERQGDSVFFADDALVDTDEFLRFVASEAITGHWDGYWKSNNHFIYHQAPTDEPERGLWSFMPWGLDQSFGQELNPFASQGVLAKKCFSLPSCKSAYTQVGLEVVSSVEGLLLQGSMQEATLLIEEYVQADPRSPHPPAKLARYQAIANARLAVLPEVMREHFSCIEDGLEQDRDGDGFGACTDDCNDTSDQARPGGTEVCDGLDNDCDGQVDEVMCPCSEETIMGLRYLFCDVMVSWRVAKSECEGRGGSLATFSERTMSDEAFAHASVLQPTRSWYLGATDSAEEGTWLDGNDQTLSTYFAPGEPDDFGGEHCAALASFADGDWEDVRCNTLLPYICQVPKQ